MIKTIVSIAGKPGLYKLVSQGRNMLIVENLLDGKRIPAYARDKVISLGDVAIYTTEDDMPLGDVLELVKEKAEGKTIDLKSFANDKAIREYFGTILSNFDDDRVYTADIRKLFQWYNILITAGITEFKAAEETEETPAE